jgi:hypothetical protein
MHELCTLFDVNYLARALVLHRSLVETGEAFRLRAYCMDERSAALLARLALPDVEVIARAELEADDPELAAVRPTRSPVEYLWTATPTICLHALQRDPELDSITYLDADLQFFAGPSAVFDEIGTSSVTIVPHRYAPRWQAFERTSGVYNVEWLTFRRDASGLEALTWWRERCLEWCYARFEDGKFGDQAYLNDWPERFQNVHVLQHPGAGLAPWNLELYDVHEDRATGRLLVDEVPLVFFHHHGLQLFRPGGVTGRLGTATGAYEATADGGGRLLWRSGYPLTPAARLLWEPYVRRLIDAYEQLRELEPGFDAGLAAADLRELSAYTRVRVGSRLRRPT